MRYLILLLLSIQVHSQIIGINGTDEFTGDKIIKVNCATGKFWDLSDRITKGIFSPVYVSCRYTKTKDGEEFYSTTLAAQFSDEQIRCVSQIGGKAIFLFDDTTTLEVKQISDSNCHNAKLEATYNLSYQDLVLLSEKTIKKLRIYFSEYHIDYEVRDKRMKALLDHYKLLLSEVKKLN